jgi:VWFA-related protein
MTQAFRGLFCVVAISALGATLGAQTSQRAGLRTRDIYVSAVDKRGNVVPGLTAADFTVREDGQVREVLSVRPADEPLTIALLVDDSAAASEATSYLREGLVALLERLHGKAETALITVGDRPTVVTQYTKETSELQQAARRIFPRSGAGAYLLDAIVDASRGLAKREASRPTILAVTFEGIDYSHQQHQQVLDELKKSGAALHVVAVGTPSQSDNDEMRNRGMAIAEGTARTGGRRDQVLAVSGLPEKLKQAADELTNQYVVTYGQPDKLIPPEKIQVATTKPNVVVRARTRVADR